MRYIALQPIKHDGKRTEPGEYVEMTQAQAAPLLASGALQATRKAAAKGAADKTEPEQQAAQEGTGHEAPPDPAAQQQPLSEHSQD